MTEIIVPKARKHLGRIVREGEGGISQPHKILFDDGHVYAVKFDNPFPDFGLRVLPAELVAGRVRATGRSTDAGDLCGGRLLGVS